MILKKGLPAGKAGFTLIELLISISIVAILVTIAAFGMQGAREASRDAKRKTDLQNIKASLELYYADCNDYPAPVSNQVRDPLVGDGTPLPRCAATNTYMSDVPVDPSTGRRYYYNRPTTTSYVLCAALETPPNPINNTGCSTSGNCGAGVTCNYRVVGP